MSNPYGGGANPYGPGYQQTPPPQPGYQAHGTFTCPKCRGTMHTYNRNSIQIEQCDTCRGIFLDFGELESITRLEGNVGPAAPPPAPHGNYGPGWGTHGRHHYRSHGFSRLFFST